MPAKAMFTTLFAYHWHTFTRLVDCAAALEEQALPDAPTFGQRSLRELFYHLLRTDQAWRLGLEMGRRVLPQIKLDDFVSAADFRTGVQAEKQAWDNLLDSLTSAQVEGDLNMADGRGGEAHLPRWRIFQHVNLHGMQHFAEIAALLTQLGKSPGDIDFIFFDEP